MPKITKELSVDVIRPNSSEMLVAKQGDSNSRFLKVKIMDDGKEHPVSGTSKVTINVERPDKQSNSYEGSVNDDGTVTVPINGWMLEVDGILECDISIINAESGSRLTSTKFYISVEEASHLGVISTDDPGYVTLEQLILEVEELKENIGELGEGSVHTEHLANYAVTRSKIALGAIAASHFGEDIMPVFVPEGESGMNDLDSYTTNGLYFLDGFEKMSTPEGLAFSRFYLFVSNEGHLGNQVILCGGEQPSLWGRAYDTGEWSEWKLLEVGGSAELTDGSVQTTHLADGAVTSDKIAEKAIDTKHLMNGAVDGGIIKTNCIITNRIKDLQITTAKIAEGAVTETKIADGAVTMDKIAYDSITLKHLYMDAAIGALHSDLERYGYTGSFSEMIATLIAVLDANHVPDDDGGFPNLPPENEYE